jgi:RNA recognition motif-containing protein
VNNTGDKTKRLFVSNLPWSTTETELIEMFRPYGIVFWARILRRDDGKSKGCGFVQMRSGEEAMQAIQTLDGSEFKGRVLIVNEAKAGELKESK